MGCVSSKHIKKDLKKETHFNNNRNHVVSLTSTTYGALKLDKDLQPQQPPGPLVPPGLIEQENKISPARRSHHGPPEIINMSELMKDLEDDLKEPVLGPEKKSPKLRKGFGDIDVKTPMKASKRFSGKENKKSGPQKAEFSPKVTIVKASTLPPNLRISKRGGCDSPVDSGLNSARRRNLGPLFDPNRVDSDRKKKAGPGTPTSQKAINSVNSVESKAMLTSFEKKSQKCPPGGENAVVIYTTTLRGIRKTFEECNVVRGIIESHQVRMIERDVSMDTGFKEELRLLLGKKEVKVPVVLIKGRLIIGSEEIMKLEEEGKLGILLEGIPKMTEGGCKGCCGVHFVMCTVCNGSCKLIGGDGRRSIKCLECNENGLVQCPICC